MKKIKLACLIDDDPIYVYGAKKVMGLANFCEESIVFDDGNQALSDLENLNTKGAHLPDIILLDINMPILDGWSFLDKFIQIPFAQKIAVFIVSSSIDPKDFDKSKTYACISDFVVKPITVNDMNKILETYYKNQNKLTINK